MSFEYSPAVVIDLRKRALAKFNKGITEENLVRLALYNIREAGHWRDDTVVMANLKVSFPTKLLSDGKRTSRKPLVVGMPSPRYWYDLDEHTFFIPAMDIIHFFTSLFAGRENLKKTVPEGVCASFASLEEWLAASLSRKFHPKLIRALVDQEKLDNENFFSKHPESRKDPGITQEMCLNVLEKVVEIDRFAWYRRYTAVNLAKAAPVWKPSPPPSENLFPWLMTDLMKDIFGDK